MTTTAFDTSHVKFCSLRFPSIWIVRALIPGINPVNLHITELLIMACEKQHPASQLPQLLILGTLP
ncbi:hypothetical protein NTG1052_390015 [Candidatus Nitrotoga sp. 1052]|nr:hypothetical protein NTG1052_390015 [Candidatus Nitrotoga sp. 1052]